MLRKETSDLVVRPRLSGAARWSVAAAAVAVIAGASLAGYWGGRVVIDGELESRQERIDALRAELRQGQQERGNLQARHRSELEALENDQRSALERSEARYQAEVDALKSGHRGAIEALRTDQRTVREKLEAELDIARDRVAETRRQLENARSSLAKATRQLQIDQTAYRELRKELEASNRQITELGSELKFYRSIISPADGRSGVRIQEFELLPTDNAHEYGYRLILIQALEHEDLVKGTVRFEVRGTENGAVRTIELPAGAPGRLPADFKYFQNFAGTFSFPPAFMPAEIKVVFEAEDEAVVERTYPWPRRDGADDA